jgi:hypothetical protein
MGDTDIVDADMKKLRDSRWKKAFSQHPGEDVTDLKATLVIEHIIQAADVAMSIAHMGRDSSLASLASKLTYCSPRRYFSNILCNIGMFIRNGTGGCLTKCLQPIELVVRRRIHPRVGIGGKFGFLTTTWSRWRRR